MRSLLVAFCAALPTTLLAQDGRTVPDAQPKELGAVSWFRNEPAAQAAAKASGKPILMLFQEVPG